MIDICELVKNNIVLKDLGKGKKIYNEYMFYGLLDSGGYDYNILFPRFILSRNLEWNKDLKNSWIDIMRNRQGKDKSKNLMRAGQSSHLICMWEDLGSVQKIREFTIIIEDIDLWRSCLSYYGITEEKLISLGLRQIWYKNYCSWDIYLPDYKLIIELDSGFHKYPEIDKARDRYFEKTLGIKTERFWEYSKNRDCERVKCILNYGKTTSFLPNQIDYVVQRYIKENSETISKLLDVIKYGYTEKDILNMSVKDYNRFGISITGRDFVIIRDICSP